MASLIISWATSRRPLSSSSSLVTSFDSTEKYVSFSSGAHGVEPPVHRLHEALVRADDESVDIGPGGALAHGRRSIGGRLRPINAFAILLVAPSWRRYATPTTRRCLPGSRCKAASTDWPSSTRVGDRGSVRRPLERWSSRPARGGACAACSSSGAARAVRSRADRTGDQQLQSGLPELLPVARVPPGVPGVARPPHRGPRGHPDDRLGQARRHAADRRRQPARLARSVRGRRVLRGAEDWHPGAPRDAVSARRHPRRAHRPAIRGGVDPLGSPRAAAARARALVPAGDRSGPTGVLRPCRTRGLPVPRETACREGQRYRVRSDFGTLNAGPPHALEDGGLAFRLARHLEGRRPRAVALLGPGDGPERGAADRRLQQGLASMVPTCGRRRAWPRSHSVMHMTGAAVAGRVGAFTVRAEAAWFVNHAYLRPAADVVAPVLAGTVPGSSKRDRSSRVAPSASRSRPLFPRLDSVEWGIGADTVWRGFIPLLQVNQIVILGKRAAAPHRQSGDAALGDAPPAIPRRPRRARPPGVVGDRAGRPLRVPARVVPGGGEHLAPRRLPRDHGDAKLLVRPVS